jgi:hypothetical protein
MNRVFFTMNVRSFLRTPARSYMRKPDESLDDYILRPAPEVIPEPPLPVSLERTGEIEVLKPLSRAEAPTGFRALRAPVRYRPLWFRRFLAVGSGALAFIALVLVSAILVGISEQSAGPDVSVSEALEDALSQPEEPLDLNSSSSSAIAQASGAIDIVEVTSRKRTARRNNGAAAIGSQPLRPLLQPEDPKFVPTTLVIYAENGVINTRIELGLQASYKKPPGIIYY